MKLREIVADIRPLSAWRIEDRKRLWDQRMHPFGSWQPLLAVVGRAAKGCEVMADERFMRHYYGASGYVDQPDPDEAKIAAAQKLQSDPAEAKRKSDPNCDCPQCVKLRKAEREERNAAMEELLAAAEDAHSWLVNHTRLFGQREFVADRLGAAIAKCRELQK